ncbi:hypothetical protein R3P38DRAFT_3244608 [Favolaschia claudopus]|uniref:Uncharacterized protein n=1 Tax=Favolaschia claudopus TaxID=2862362 RepID=A0AAV9Z1T6_9AGAR
MSAAANTPPLVDSRDKIFLERLNDGMYDSVNKQIKERSTSLALLEYMGTKKRPATVFRGVDWAGNIVFNDGPGKNADELRGTIFGEIAEPVHGTMVSARGNHFEGNTSATFKPIDDKNKVKDVLVLRAPTLCEIKTSALWNNQRALLQDIVSVEKTKDDAFGWHPYYSVPFRSSTTENPREDMIAICTQKKYGIPTAAGVPSGTPPVTPQKAVRAKRTFFAEDGVVDSDDEEEVAEVRKRATPDAPDDSVKTPEFPGRAYLSWLDSFAVLIAPLAEKILLGAFYDPRLLEDFGGPSFNLTKAMLRQLDHRGPDNKLIPPWKNYSAFRPGTLIVATVSIHIYTFKVDGPDRDKDRKIFQLEAHTIRVLDESDFPVEKRRIHIPRHLVDQPSSDADFGVSAAGDSLTNFVFTPRKKRTVDAIEPETPGVDDDDMDLGGSSGDGASGSGGSPSKRRKSGLRR